MFLKLRINQKTKKKQNLIKEENPGLNTEPKDKLEKTNN